MYMYVNIWSAFTTEQLNEYLQNVVGMKYSWPYTLVRVFWPYAPHGGSRAGQKRGPFLHKTSSSHWKATTTNRMHCIMYIYFV